MATFRCSVSTISRSSGRSSVAAAAYRAGVRLTNDRDGVTHDYRGRARDILASGILTPKDTPEWARDRSQLWNAAEAAENRKNSVTAREVQLSLPHELDDTQRAELVHRFGRELVRRYGVAVDFSIHRPDSKGDARNHHAHILMTTRRMGRDGLGEKTRELDDRSKGKDGSASRGSAEVEHLRKLWCDLENRALERARVSERVDHRSYARQGIEREAEPRLGPHAHAMEQRGQPTIKAAWREAQRLGDRQRAEDAALVYHLRQVETHAKKPAPKLARSPNGRRWTYDQPPRSSPARPAQTREQFNARAMPAPAKSQQLPPEAARYLETAEAKTWKDHYKRQREAVDQLDKRHQWEREQMAARYAAPPSRQQENRRGIVSRIFGRTSESREELEQKKQAEAQRVGELARLAIKQEDERRALIERDKSQRRALARSISKGTTERQRAQREPERTPHRQNARRTRGEDTGRGARSMLDERKRNKGPE